MNSPLIKLLESARGLMESEHIIELLSFLCLIAKEDPQGYEQTLQFEFAQQHSALDELGVAISKHHNWPAIVTQAPDINKLNPEVMSQALTLVADLKDYSIISQARQLLTERMGKRGWTAGANLTMVTLFYILIGNCSNKTVYDGAGGLAQIVSALNPKQALLEEKHPATWVIAYRLLLLENRQFELLNTDALSHDPSSQHQADIVAMEPPFSLRFSADQRRSLAKSSYLQVPTGDTLPASAGDVLWVQKAISMLKPEGEAYLLLPQGWLFRGGYDAKVRSYLLEHGLIETIIGLPANILAFTGIPPVLMIFKKGRKANSAVTFIDASEMGTVSGNRRMLTEKDALLIKELSAGQHPDDPRYRSVAIAEIAAQDNNLNIPYYIQKPTEIEALSVREEFEQLAAAQKAYDTANKKLIELLRQFNTV